MVDVQITPHRHLASTGSTAPAPVSGRDLLTDELIETHLEVARSMALRYRNRGIDVDDLEQVALLGLTKAAHRFDPDAGHEFLSFAVPTIRGELRRHFRDCGWMVRPPRRIQELQARIGQVEDELLARHGHSPRPSDIAAHLDVDVDDVVDALSIDGCFTPAALETPVGDGTSTLADFLGSPDEAYGAAEAALMLEPAVRQLTPRDRRIVYLRFYEERSQEEIGDAVGLSQAQVSRVLNRILKDIRDVLGGQAPVA
ncbi:RNA polymerase sigma factor [Nocardioides flavus (ex Wang et al. 2016)]|uniref:RNA polymerase sigma factor n=1 Tax=Nocardioides flavus (ex Wang et al. 2016) TaxID=2058780 RepID=A0ABQ3HKD2_9ACTN|nr:sigma-70 family RNA polymerase sigma factor [Nocardioides flavus (ex Wang et al. 2016)]GHE16544.1 RNA polymerase sigma factor [Nocardioides flavus (ex Wang et al. 2016)]